jgi:glycosyltransferase involved in cell wall biosynthesis
MEWLTRKLSRKMIYDIDDLVYKAETSPNNKFIKYLKSDAKVNFLMKHSDHLFVSTNTLSLYAKQFNQSITLIPATVDITKYEIQKVRATNIVTIGWSGSHTTSKYLHLLDDVLKKVSQRQQIEIIVMGDKSFNIDNLEIRMLEWSAEKEAENLMKFDIGLHPLPDEEWVYGKSGGKLVQYMAAGIPIVASAIGANFQAIKEGYNGFLVNTDEEWITKLELLINDASLRKQMGLNSKQMAKDIYSVDANLTKYLSVFNAL